MYTNILHVSLDEETIKDKTTNNSLKCSGFPPTDILESKK